MKAWTNITAALLGAANVFKTVNTFMDSIVLPKDGIHGIKVDTDAPTFGWADILGPIQARASGGANPVFSVWHGGIYQYSFGTAAGVTEVYNIFHIPHDYVPGSDVFVHTHWSTIAAAPTGSIDWMFEAAYAKGYSQERFTGTTGLDDTVTVGVVQAVLGEDYHMIAETQASAAGGLMASAINVSITSGAAILTAASALFANGDIGKSVAVLGAGAAGATLYATITVFTSSTQVTLSANAGTTVTAQPNFRWRVLDSARLEPDGLIVLRTWRNASRAADTLSDAPFLHMVDIHYQSNAVTGTKGRNFPFYT